jgi:hypothetical protein
MNLRSSRPPSEEEKFGKTTNEGANVQTFFLLNKLVPEIQDLPLAIFFTLRGSGGCGGRVFVDKL